MLDEDIKENKKMMDQICIPLCEHPNGTHYSFDNDIRLGKKKAGHLHFELDFLSLDGSAPEPAKLQGEIAGDYL